MSEQELEARMKIKADDLLMKSLRRWYTAAVPMSDFDPTNVIEVHSRFLIYEEVFIDRPIKNRNFRVWSKSNPELLGFINYHNSWRKYVFTNDQQAIFDQTCLREICVQLDRLMAERSSRLNTEKINKKVNVAKRAT